MKGLGRSSYLALVFGFLYLPIAVLIIYSFNDAKYSLEWKGFTWNWYQTLWQNDDLIEVALHSLTIALLSATLATIVGTLGAVALYRYQFSGKKLLNGLIFILIMSPEIVMGISLLLLFVTLGMDLGFSTLLLSHTTFSIPFVVVTVLSRMSGFDKFLIEAAKDLGATEFQTFIKVILPLLMPAVVAGWLLSFTLSMDDVIISFFVTGPDYEVLPLKVYSMVRLGVKPEINALSTVMFALTLVLVLLAQFFLKEKK
ncbi:spermidine/putrescine ABC transporter permease PotC [Plasticicumulans acidivorans]|uniref:Spermidine/putrescine transport system permease protein PotC n=1 Tax=Plasticicumulans acidivorans TaxID=886464 RepID=A0A317MZJ0_9GAMM|nr:spermidine/putrescine ABC transporter permease PotC [Plasticicumulans acidivorans]PWV64526.1 ABC-type spermidine/putrescine transport system permease subunit II [Plasticicumulans acidivorans]